MRIHPISFLPVWALLAVLAGCTRAPAPPAYRIGFSQCSIHGEWRQAVLAGMERELSFHPDVQLSMLNAQENSSLQRQQIRQLVGQGADLLIVSANDPQAVTPAVEEAYQRGIPVVLLDRRLASTAYTAYVGGDNEEVGLTAARYAARLLHERGSVLEVLGGHASPAALGRHRGFVQGLAAYPGLRLAAQVPGEWNVTTMQQPLRAALLAHPEIRVIFTHNDHMGLSAAQVLRQLGRERQVRIIGVDALRLEPVRRGVLTASILYATAGEDAIRTALQILHHQPFRRETTLGTLVVDSTNVLTMQRQTDKIATQQADIARQQGLLSKLLSTYATLQTALYGLLAMLLLAVGLGALAWRSARHNRLINEQLARQNARNDEINQQLSHQNEEIRQQRNQLEALAEQARTDTEAKLRFFTNFSHELRTPLTLILGPVEELLNGGSPLTRAQRHDVSLVRRNTQRLLQLVNQLLDFRKLEVGKMAVRASEGDLVAFVRELAEPFEKSAQLRGIRLQVLAAEPRLPAWFDGNVLDKVFLNLLSNALKFTPENGRITVSLHLAEQGQAVRVSVADTGPGIAEADQPHVFEWFYQGTQAVAANGSGMGLALAYSLVRLHQGQLTFSSQPGRGSTFTVTLPRELPERLHATGPVLVPGWEYAAGLPPPDDDEPEPEPAVPVTDALVLVVEDNPEVQDFLARKLRGHYRVRSAPDGYAGVQLATELLPDLVVCDVMMPGLSGLELVQQLKHDWRTSHIPVVLLTARHAPEQQVEGVQAGADLYLTKPFNPTFLLESLRTLLANRQRQREHFRRELSLDLATVPPGPDQKFLADLTAVVEANLTKTDLSVEEVAGLLGLSRMQLYRKVKALLGTGVTDFIQRLRLTRARELLLDERRTVADVAYEMGFSSPSYFTASFRAQYQLTPSEFRALHVATGR
ncbi:MAG: hybrid sensor histidine kinase/response regulator transcription factor [Janthinobacterium lividum]